VAEAAGAVAKAAGAVAEAAGVLTLPARAAIRIRTATTCALGARGWPFAAAPARAQDALAGGGLPLP
jgi:hypothetical protein